MARMRLDVLLVEQGLFPSREQARTAIMSRRVSVDGQIVDKAGAQVRPEADLQVSGRQLPFVSRGGLKLAKAVQSFGLDFSGLVVADIGGQLAWKLRQDERVVVLEKTNARYLTERELPEPLDAATIDAAFISLGKLLPALFPLLKPEGFVVALIKPQFEAGRDKVGKKGVVRDCAVHLEVIRNVQAAAADLGYHCWGLDFSPIKGPEGNIEYLLWLGKRPGANAVPEPSSVVAAAFATLQTEKNSEINTENSADNIQ